MLQIKFVTSVYLLTLALCSMPTNGPEIKNDQQTKTGDFENDKVINKNNFYGVWGGGDLNGSQMSNYPYFKGWYCVYQWKDLEPQKDNFNWNYFDKQMKFAADNNLSIGFMVWVGPHSPEWLYTNGVPKVETDTKKKRTEFPYYLDATYKERYFKMMKAVADHLQTLPADIREKVIMWMSGEGSTGDITPYKGRPLDPKYSISEEQWFNFKKEVWTYLYKICQSEKPRVNLLVNQGNGGQYFNWLTTNLPKVWMKAGNISHTYQFNGELEYYNRLKKLEAKIEEDSSANRLRGEITVGGKWFNQNESWNMYALLTSALHFGLDIFNINVKYLQYPADSVTFNFFNLYAGEKVARKSPGAFCVLRDGLDAADTKRFPESKYGPVIDPSKMNAYNEEVQRKNRKAMKNDDEEDDGTDESADQSNAKNNNLSAERVNKILEEFAPYGAKRGDMNDLSDDNTSPDEASDNSSAGNQRNPNKQPRNPNRAMKNPNREGRHGGGGKNKQFDDEGGGTAYQKNREANMVVNDIGVNLIPDNYYRFLTQYSPNTTSRGYWRIGPTDQPYGRFARGFDAKNNMKEMFFTLDKPFFQGSSNAQTVAIRIIYLDKGNGSWSLNYNGGGSKKEAYTVNCGNSGRWIIKTVVLQDAYFTQKLEHNCDLSIKYVSGDNAIFNSIEILRQ